MKRLHAKVNRGDERMIAVAQPHAANSGEAERGGEFNRSNRPRSVTTVVWSKPPAASQRSHHRSCVMWLRREPNNRSKPTHLKSFSATQHKSPSESKNFPVLIQPNFLMVFFGLIFSVRNCPVMRIRICWRRAQNDHSPVTKPHHTER